MNKHGGGIAWVSGDKVHYKKNLDAKEMMKVIKNEARLPAIVHFRIASVGHIVPELCHPFPIEDGVTTKLHGITDKVLFHNGTWDSWKDTLLQSLISTNKKLPKGYWSDSRAMAYIANEHDESVLNLVDGKIAVLSVKGIKKYGSGWVDVDKNSCSNNYFIPSTITDKTSYSSIASLYKEYGIEKENENDEYESMYNRQSKLTDDDTYYRMWS